MKTEKCLFCKIAKGEIPCEKIWENGEILAFLDISPTTDGHTLIIPKKHYENIFDIPEEILKECFAETKKISLLLKNKLGAEGINLINNNDRTGQQEIFHYHIHVIPRYSGDKFKIISENKTKNKELKKTADKIRE